MYVVFFRFFRREKLLRVFFVILKFGIRRFILVFVLLVFVYMIYSNLIKGRELILVIVYSICVKFFIFVLNFYSNVFREVLCLFD